MTNDERDTEELYSDSRREFLGVVGALGAVLVAGCAESEPDETAGGDADVGGGDSTATSKSTQTPESTQTQEGDLKFLSHEGGESAGWVVITGKIKNISGRTLDYVQVTAKLFDSEGTRVGEGLWNATDVDAEQVLEFEAMSTTEIEKVDSYELTASTSP